MCWRTPRAQSVSAPDELRALPEALETLAGLDPMLARKVDRSCVCGFTVADIARVHGVAERTVQRH